MLLVEFWDDMSFPLFFLSLSLLSLVVVQTPPINPPPPAAPKTGKVLG